jgi:Fur family ferric uptake transcriptional regulator
MVQERLSNAGISISPATVYRQLEHLAEEGLVVKSTPEGEKSACFELVDRASCHDDSCYHLKCESCGMLFHSDCHEVDKLKMHMSKEHGFLIDARRTVIYGLCQDCRERHQK